MSRLNVSACALTLVAAVVGMHAMTNVTHHLRKSMLPRSEFAVRSRDSAMPG